MNKLNGVVWALLALLVGYLIGTRHQLHDFHQPDALSHTGGERDHFGHLLAEGWK